MKTLHSPFATIGHVTSFFYKHDDSAEYMLSYFPEIKKSSLKYATMPIFVSKSFKLVFLQLKEILLRICMGKRRFVL